MMTCGSHCWALGVDFDDKAPRRCLTRVFHERKAQWLDGEDLEQVNVFQCRWAPIQDADVAFLPQLPGYMLDKIESLAVWCNISDAMAQALAKIVRHSPAIKYFAISSKKIEEGAYAETARALEKNTSLEELALYNSEVPVEPSMVHPLFVYALLVNPDRPQDSRWSFTDVNTQVGFDFEKVQEEAQRFAFVLECRERAKSGIVRAAKMIAKAPTVCYKQKVKKLRKQRAGTELLEQAYCDQ